MKRLWLWVNTLALTVEEYADDRLDKTIRFEGEKIHSSRLTPFWSFIKWKAYQVKGFSWARAFPEEHARRQAQGGGFIVPDQFVPELLKAQAEGRIIKGEPHRVPSPGGAAVGSVDDPDWWRGAEVSMKFNYPAIDAESFNRLEKWFDAQNNGGDVETDSE